MAQHLDLPLRRGGLQLEPNAEADTVRLIGHARARREIVDYVARNAQGRFLISGYSGVGKSSLIDAVLQDLRARSVSGPLTERTRPLAVLKLPAQTLADPAVVSKRLMWHLHWEVRAGRVRVNDSARERLLQSYDGVAGNAREVLVGNAESVEASADVASPLKLGAKATVNNSRQEKTVYVPYDLHTSLLEIGQLIAQIASHTEVRSWWRRYFERPARGGMAPLPVIVIDRIADWTILSALANLFATSGGAVFLVVVPPQVRSEWRARKQAGHEDLPSFQDVYLPCLWDEMPAMLAEHIDTSAADERTRQLYEQVIGFLSFSSAGIPRECVEILLRHCEVDGDGRRVVRFDERDIATIEFFNMLYRIVKRREADILGEFLASFSDADRDRARRCVLVSLREMVGRGSVSRSNPTEGLSPLADALRPPEYVAIVRQLTEVLVDEGVLAGSGDTLSLSKGARTRVAQAREILGTGILPRLSRPVVQPEQSSSGATPAPTPPKAASVPTARGDLTGQILADRYRLLAKLGEGAMGQVYLGEHLKMQRRSAVKVMHRGMSHDADAVRRFEREAQNGSRITHPNVASIYDFGETAEGHVYLVMEYIEGEPLATVMERDGRLPSRRVVEIIRQTAAALAAAHELGIVHRDVKPANIMLAKTRDGSDLVKVVDFGIAKAASSEGQKLTQTGLIVGTPEYMSPEQLTGDSLDGRSDIFSLGIVAFEMVTGAVPFPSRTQQESMIMRLTDKPQTLARARPGETWPQGLQEVFDRVLSRDAESRYQSATEFAADLARCY